MVKRQLQFVFVILIVFSLCFSTSSDVIAEDREIWTDVVFIPLVMTSSFGSIVNGGFESGNDGSWTLFSYQGLVEDIIYTPEVGDTVLAYEGQYIAWLGGYQEEQTQISQSVMIKENKTNLSFWYWIESTDLCNPDYGYDTFRVKIDGSSIYELNLCPNNNSTQWQQQVLNLDAYINATVEILFEVTTNETSVSDEYGSSVYLDLISLE